MSDTAKSGDKKTLRDEKATETKCKILIAARDLFLKRDFHSVSTQEIAKKAGVAKGTVFHHFENKELLALTVLAKFMSDMLDEVKQLKYQLPIDAFLRNLVKISLELVTISPGFVQLLLQLVANDQYINKEPTNIIENKIKEEVMKVYSFFQGYIDEFTDVFDKKGHPTPEIQARLFIGILDGIGLQLYIEPNANNELIEQITHGIGSLFIREEGS